MKAKYRIMLVDDHPNTAATLARALARLRAGIEVIPVTSGDEAIALADDKALDVLITDMMMPGMHGLELIERLQAHQAERLLHVILLTACDVPVLQEMSQRLHVHCTLIKPVPPQHVCRVVNHLFDTIQSTRAESERHRLEDG